MKTEERIKNLLERLKILRLSGIRAHLEEFLMMAEMEKMTALDLIERMVDIELDSRSKNRLVTCVRQAGLVEKVLLDDIQLPEGYGLNDFELKVLRQLIWARYKYNLVIIGPHGSGKTTLIQGLTTDAVAQNIRPLYLHSSKFAYILKNKDTDARCMKLFKNIKRAKVVLLDDVDEMSLEKEDALACKKLLDEINKTTSIVVTATNPIKEWETVFHDEFLGVAVVGRITKKCETITLKDVNFHIKQHEGFFEKFAKGVFQDTTPVNEQN